MHFREKFLRYECTSYRLIVCETLQFSNNDANIPHPLYAGSIEIIVGAMHKQFFSCFLFFWWRKVEQCNEQWKQKSMVMDPSKYSMIKGHGWTILILIYFSHDSYFCIDELIPARISPGQYAFQKKTTKSKNVKKFLFAFVNLNEFDAQSIMRLNCLKKS